MTNKTHVELFDGYQIEVPVQAHRLTPHQQAVVRRAIAQDTPQELRFRCLVAEAVNDAFGGTGKPEEYADIQIGDRLFRLNPKAKAQFGVDHDGHPYLTVGLIDLTVADKPVRYRMTWRGDDVPHTFKRLAVAHDSGASTPTRRVRLALDTATVHILGEKDGSKRNDPRRNHDTAPDGNPYPRPPRRNHLRVCVDDL